jgi:twinkle protein
VATIKDNIDFAKYLQGPTENPSVRAPDAYGDEIKSLFRRDADGSGLTLPWRSTHPNVRIRPGEVTIYAGINGHGKSLILSQIELWLMRQGEKICKASMEMRPAESLHRMVQQAAGVPLPGDDYVDAFTQWLSDKLYLFDQMGTVKRDRILSLARYSQKELGCGHIVIDSLMKCGIGIQDYDGQKSFIDELCAHAKDTGQHVHLVAHSRKGQNEAEDTIDKFSVKGASEITDQVDNLFLVWRNRAKEKSMAAGEGRHAAEPDCLLSHEKQRHGKAGSEQVYGLALDHQSQSFIEKGGRIDPLILETGVEVLF